MIDNYMYNMYTVIIEKRLRKRFNNNIYQKKEDGNGEKPNNIFARTYDIM